MIRKSGCVKPEGRGVNSKLKCGFLGVVLWNMHKGLWYLWKVEASPLFLWLELVCTVRKEVKDAAVRNRSASFYFHTSIAALRWFLLQRLFVISCNICSGGMQPCQAVRPLWAALCSEELNSKPIKTVRRFPLLLVLISYNISSNDLWAFLCSIIFCWLFDFFFFKSLENSVLITKRLNIFSSSISGYLQKGSRAMPASRKWRSCLDIIVQGQLEECFLKD